MSATEAGAIRRGFWRLCSWVPLIGRAWRWANRLCERNHFDPRYRVSGEKWTVPRLDLQYRAYTCARDAFAATGGAVLNASRETALDVFPRVDFESLFTNGDGSRC